MRAKVQGIVRLRAWCNPTGTVGDVHVTRSLDSTFGPDQKPSGGEAVPLRPGTRFGEPVAVLVSFEIVNSHTPLNFSSQLPAPSLLCSQLPPSQDWLRGELGAGELGAGRWECLPGCTRARN